MSAYSADPKAEHLLRLSEEVNRIAGSLARLSVQADTGDQDGLGSPVGPDFIMSVIRARRLRSQFFDELLFADPAWDILLELYHAELTHRRITVSSLGWSAAVPATTALRWLTTLVKGGLCVRRNDPLDGRRVYVELTPSAADALHRYFAKLNASLVV